MQARHWRPTAPCCWWNRWPATRWRATSIRSASSIPARRSSSARPMRWPPAGTRWAPWRPTKPSGRWCAPVDRKSTRLNSSHVKISYAVFCLKKKKAHKKPLRVGEIIGNDYVVLEGIKAWDKVIVSGTQYFVDFAFFFFNDTATTEIYTLSLHDALPISVHLVRLERVADVAALAALARW